MINVVFNLSQRIIHQWNELVIVLCSNSYLDYNKPIKTYKTLQSDRLAGFKLLSITKNRMYSKNFGNNVQKLLADACILAINALKCMLMPKKSCTIF